MGSQTRNVILYELNEVPWSVVGTFEKCALPL